jgi:hypothetical protein
LIDPILAERILCHNCRWSQFFVGGSRRWIKTLVLRAYIFWSFEKGIVYNNRPDELLLENVYVQALKAFVRQAKLAQRFMLTSLIILLAGMAGAEAFAYNP